MQAAMDCGEPQEEVAGVTVAMQLSYSLKSPSTRYTGFRVHG